MVIVVAAILLVLYIHANFSLSPLSFGLASSPNQREVGDEILPVPSRTYVSSLPHRKDRYKDMERFRTRLGVRWTYVVGEDCQSSLVGRIMSQVRSMREEELKMKGCPPNTIINLARCHPGLSQNAEFLRVKGVSWTTHITELSTG